MSCLIQANVLIRNDGTVILADFGLIVISDVGTSQTRHGRVGAAAWRAPELLEDENPIRPTNAAAIYAFGCVCVEVRGFFYENV